jgi:hypothetical protein
VTSSGTSLISQFAKQINEHHLINGPGRSAGNAWIGDDHRQALGAGDGDINPVSVQNESESA